MYKNTLQIEKIPDSRSAKKFNAEMWIKEAISSGMNPRVIVQVDGIPSLGWDVCRPGPDAPPTKEAHRDVCLCLAKAGRWLKVSGNTAVLAFMSPSEALAAWMQYLSEDAGGVRAMKDTKRPHGKQGQDRLQTEPPVRADGDNVIRAEFGRPAKPFGLIEFIRECGIPRSSAARSPGVVTSIIRLANDNSHA